MEEVFLSDLDKRVALFIEQKEQGEYLNKELALTMSKQYKFGLWFEDYLKKAKSIDLQANKKGFFSEIKVVLLHKFICLIKIYLENENDSFRIFFADIYYFSNCPKANC